jgi:hypothetical protein
MYKDESFTINEFNDILSRLLVSGAFIVGGNMVKDILMKVVDNIQKDSESES